MARAAVATLPISPCSLPRSDYKCLIRRTVRDSWHWSWRQTRDVKLKEALPDIPHKYVNPYPRNWSIKLTRLLIGHTRLTHSYLMSGDPLPYCEDCIVPLTVRHILLECPSYEQHRQLFGFPGPPTMRAMFASDNCGVNGPLYTFLHQIALFHLL